MNLKDFKKVYEDDHKATMRNGKGHEFSIAKKSLSAKHIKALKELPLHASDGSFVNNFMAQNDSPGQAMDGRQPMPATQAQPAPDTQDNQDAEEDSSPDTNRAPTQAAQPYQSPQPDTQTQREPPQSPVWQAQEPTPQQQRQKSFDDYNAEHAAEFGQQDAAFSQDLRNGHIQPETYRSLYAKKDTLGKIGTMFGLMLSGAGSGLAHQPNAVMHMMDQEINNDLEAQKNSKSNAQNFLRLNQQNELNKANIGLVKTQTKGAGIENDIKATTLARNQMVLSALHGLQLESDKIPANSPLKPRFLQTLNGVQQAAVQNINQNNQKSAAQLAGISQAKYVEQTNKLRTAGALGQEPALGALAENREKKMIPDVGYADRDVPQEKIDRLTGITNYQNRLSEYKQLADKISSGIPLSKWSPEERGKAEAIRSDLISGYNDVKGLKRFTGNEEDLYSKIIPDVKKMDLVNFFGGARNNILNLEKSVQRIKDQEFKSAGVHPFSDAGSLGGGPHQSEQTGTSKSGKPIVFKNGKWMYK